MAACVLRHKRWSDVINSILWSGWLGINTAILSLSPDPRPIDFGKDPVFNPKPPIDEGELSLSPLSANLSPSPPFLCLSACGGTHCFTSLTQRIVKRCFKQRHARGSSLLLVIRRAESLWLRWQTISSVCRGKRVVISAWVCVCVCGCMHVMLVCVSSAPLFIFLSKIKWDGQLPPGHLQKHLSVTVTVLCACECVCQVKCLCV